jgi:hypothetical protein
LPFALLGLILCLIFVPKNEARAKTKFDPLGAALLAGAIAALIISLSQWGRPGWSTGEIIFFLVSSLVLFYALWRWENHCACPLLDIKMFYNRVFLSGNIAGLCSFLALNSTGMLVPFYLHRVLNATPRTMGMVLIVFPVMLIIAAPLSGSLSDRYGAPRFSITGMGLMGLALALLAVFAPQRSLYFLAPTMALFGAANGMFQAPNNSTTLAVIPVEKHGMAGSIIALMRNFGAVIGIALSVRTCEAVSDFYIGGAPLTPELEKTAFIAGFQAACAVGIVFALLGMASSFSKKKSISLAEKNDRR